MEIVIFLIILFFIVVAIFTIKSATNDGAEIRELRSDLESEYPEANVHVSHEDGSFLVVDFARGQIVIGLDKLRGTVLAQEQPYRSVIPFAEIVKVQVLKDGVQVASTNRGSQALGAAVGAIAFGGVGAVVGALSGSSTSSGGTKRLIIQVTVNDTSKPIHEVTFYQTDRKKGGKRGEIFFDRGAQQVALFAAHLEAAIRRSDEGRCTIGKSASDFNENDDFSSQIEKLWSLKVAGALTQEEYEAEKAKLISV